MAYALPLETDERHLVASFRAGEADAFDSLFRRYSPPLSRFCRGRLVNLGDVEDAVQETLTRACQASLRFRRGAKLWPWLTVIAANVCRDINRVRSRLIQDPDVGLCDGRDAHYDDPDEQIARKVRVQVVDDALETLPRQFRALIHLRDFEDWGYEDIANFQGTSVASVRTALMRARRLLKERIREVAEARGQWPLPAFIPLGWTRLRSSVDKWAMSIRNWSATVGARLAQSPVIEYFSSSAPAVMNAAAATIVALGIVAGTFVGGAPAEADIGAEVFGNTPSAQMAFANGHPGQNATEVSQTSLSGGPTDSATTSDSSNSAATASDSLPPSAGAGPQGSSQTTEVEAGGSSIEVSIDPADEGGSDSNGSIETPGGSANVDPETGGEDARVEADKGPAGIDCQDPGVVIGTVCSVSDEAEDVTETLPTLP